MTEGMNEYDKHPELWTLISDTFGTDYRSVPTEKPGSWKRERIAGDILIYRSGEYEIRGQRYGTKRSYEVYRQGIKLPLTLTGSLRDAKFLAVKNAEGRYRMHVA